MSQVSKPTGSSKKTKKPSNVSVLKPKLAAVSTDANDNAKTTEKDAKASAPKKDSAKARLAASAKKTASAKPEGSTPAQAKKKAEPKKPAAKKASAPKKSAAKPAAKKAPAKKTVASKPAAKKTSPKKAAPKKSASAKKASTNEKASSKKASASANPFEDIQNLLFGGLANQAEKAQDKQRAFQHEAVASLEKAANDAAKITQSLFAIAKETTEALLESSSAAAKDLEKLNKNVAALAEDIAGEAADASRQALKAKDLRDAVRIQDEAARKNVARKIDAAIALNKAAGDSVGKTLEPLQKRLKKSAEAVAEVLFPDQK